MNDVVSYETEGEVAVITADNPPVNALSHAVRTGVVDALRRAEADPEVRGIALLCAGRTFFAGADITEFGKPPKSPTLRDQHDEQESVTKPIVAGMFGTTLGGGLETAMACHYRIALPQTKGRPAGSQARHPPRRGRHPAPAPPDRPGTHHRRSSASGDPIGAEEALELGVIDRIVRRRPAHRDDRRWSRRCCAPMPPS